MSLCSNSATERPLCPIYSELNSEVFTHARTVMCCGLQCHHVRGLQYRGKIGRQFLQLRASECWAIDCKLHPLLQRQVIRMQEDCSNWEYCRLWLDI